MADAGQTRKVPKQIEDDELRFIVRHAVQQFRVQIPVPVRNVILFQFAERPVIQVDEYDVTMRCGGADGKKQEIIAQENQPVRQVEEHEAEHRTQRDTRH